MVKQQSQAQQKGQLTLASAVVHVGAEVVARGAPWYLMVPRFENGRLTCIETDLSAP
jgi:hypothetical protein